MSERLPSPLETEEQVRVVQFLELQGLRFTSVPNSTYTKSWKQKTHNTAVGLRPGFPDLIVLISPQQDKYGTGRLLAIEMKRVAGGTVSKSQREWIAALNGLESFNVDSVVARGADEAIEYISGYLKRVHTTVF